MSFKGFKILTVLVEEFLNILSSIFQESGAMQGGIGEKQKFPHDEIVRFFETVRERIAQVLWG